MLKEQKKTMLKEVKESMLTLSPKGDNINKEVEIIQVFKRNQIEILELKNSLKEIQNTFENFKNRLNQAEGTNSELKDESFEII